MTKFKTYAFNEYFVFSLMILVLLICSNSYALTADSVNKPGIKQLKACDGQSSFLCGNIVVPLDYSNPKLGNIALPIKYIKRLSKV